MRHSYIYTDYKKKKKKKKKARYYQTAFMQWVAHDD